MPESVAPLSFVDDSIFEPDFFDFGFFVEGAVGCVVFDIMDGNLIEIVFILFGETGTTTF